MLKSELLLTGNNNQLYKKEVSVKEIFKLTSFFFL